jgi:lipopolysaccharide export LptBFGC system permease protein LptF
MRIVNCKTIYFYIANKFLKYTISISLSLFLISVIVNGFEITGNLSNAKTNISISNIILLYILKAPFLINQGYEQINNE